LSIVSAVQPAISGKQHEKMESPINLKHSKYVYTL